MAAGGAVSRDREGLPDTGSPSAPSDSYRGIWRQAAVSRTWPAWKPVGKRRPEETPGGGYARRRDASQHHGFEERLGGAGICSARVQTRVGPILRVTWTAGNMALRGARSARGVRSRSSGGKVHGAVNAMLSATDALRAACRSSRPGRGPCRGGEWDSTRCGMRASGEGRSFEIESPRTAAAGEPAGAR